MDEVENTLSQLRQDIEAALQAFKTHLSKLRTGRANLAMLDDIRVKYNDELIPLNRCAVLSVAEARLLTVRPWDKSLIPEIEKAILAANLGITPQNAGDMLRLPIPTLTQARREELVRQAKKLGEDILISFRTHRRSANEKLKKLSIPQDDLKRALETVQKYVDEASRRAEQLLNAKETEIQPI